MRCLHNLPVHLAAAAVLGVAGAAGADTLPLHICTYGHVHGGVDYDAGTQQLNLHVASEGATVDGAVSGAPGREVEFAPEEIQILVPATTRQTAPSGLGYAGWEFLGVPEGGTYYRLSASSYDCYIAEGTPYFGFATEEIAPGIFQDDTLTFSLTCVKAAPPGGQVSMYMPPTGPGDAPLRYMDSADGSFSNDHLDMPVAEHGHFCYGFSKPGDYQVEYTVSGHLLDGTPISDSAVLMFQVVPEPGTPALLGCAAAATAIAAVRRRRQLPPRKVLP